MCMPPAAGCPGHLQSGFSFGRAAHRLGRHSKLELPTAEAALLGFALEMYSIRCL
jgi:hypothetical protein